MTNLMPVRRRHLIHQLKRLRVEAKLTQDDVWKAMGWSRNKIQRIEKGDFQRIKAADVIALCQYYGASQQEADELVEIARQSRQHKPWWFQYDDVLPSAYIGLEAEARMIQEFTIGLVPGLFQTYDYMSALIKRAEGVTVPHEELQTRIDARLERQKSILEAPQPPAILSVIDEAALRRQVGGPDVMREQVRHLHELAQKPHVEIQTFPYTAGAYAGGAVPFTILSFESGTGSVVFLETYYDGFCIEADNEVTRHRLVFSRMQAAAMSVEDSASLLTDLIS